jgi:pyruvate dehydrogenase (quinone)
VLEVRTDPNVPPLPPHITFKQATAYMKAITKGDPEAWAMVRQSFREMADSFVPRT